MKVKPEIKDRILSAANALASEGIENPTNDQVRERMGGGSLSHISPVMREWRESHKVKVAAALEMPGDLKRAVETSVSQMWSVASKLASTTIETVRQEADQAVDEASKERDEALGEISRLEESIASLQQLMAEKDKAIDQVKSELVTERSNNTQLKSDNAALSTKVDDRDAQLKSLKAESEKALSAKEVVIDKLREDLDAERAKLTTLSSENAVYSTRIEEREKQIESLKSEVSTAAVEKGKAVKEFQLELDNLRAEKQKLAEQQAVFESRIDDRSEQIKALQSELKDARADNKKLQLELVGLARKPQK